MSEEIGFIPANYLRQFGYCLPDGRKGVRLNRGGWFMDYSRDVENGDGVEYLNITGPDKQSVVVNSISASATEEHEPFSQQSVNVLINTGLINQETEDGGMMIREEIYGQLMDIAGRFTEAAAERYRY